MGMTRQLRIEIDEIVLRGVRPEEAHAVVADLEQALRFHATAWTGSRRRIAPRVEASRRAAPLSVSGPAPSNLGVEVARTVFGTIAHPGERR